MGFFSLVEDKILICVCATSYALHMRRPCLTFMCTCTLKTFSPHVSQRACERLEGMQVIIWLHFEHAASLHCKCIGMDIFEQAALREHFDLWGCWQ